MATYQRQIALPPPFLGERNDIPVAALKSPYAERIINFNVDQGLLSLRKADSYFYASGPGLTQKGMFTYGQNSSQVLYSYSQNSGTGKIEIASIDDSGVYTIVYNPSYAFAPSLSTTLYFNNYLFLFDFTALSLAGLGPIAYSGSAWGAAGYTFGSGIPYGGGVYKNRAYIIDASACGYYYTGINAITGAVTYVDLSQIVESKCTIRQIHSISVSQGVVQQNVLAFVMSNGEVLIYSGAYPLSSDWGIINRFNIGSPLGYTSYAKGRGDTFVFTQIGVFSLRELFTSGDASFGVKGISQNICNRWTQILVDYKNQASFVGYNNITGVYDNTNQRIIVSFPYNAPEDSTILPGYKLRLIFSFKTNSWIEAMSAGSAASTDISDAIPMISYKNNIYYTIIFNSLSGGGVNILEVEGSSAYLDGEVSGFPYQFISAPFYSESFGTNTTTTVELINKTDASAGTYYTLIGNIGESSTTPQLLPSQGNNIANPAINIGNFGNYMQLKVQGETTNSISIGLDFYAFNYWAEKGNVR